MCVYCMFILVDIVSLGICCCVNIVYIQFIQAKLNSFMKNETVAKVECSFLGSRYCQSKARK